MRVLSQGEIDSLLKNLLPDSSILPSEPAAAPAVPSSLAEKIAAANAAKAAESGGNSG